jgi:quinohemoprotein ethanol dehydrogenase
MQAPKNGFFYVLDRETGALISAEPYVVVNWASHIDPESGRPVETSAADYREAPKLVVPAPQGGHNWHPMTFHPETGLVYFSARDMAYWFVNDPTFDPGDRGKWALGQDGDEQIRLAELEPPADPVGFLLAWDPVAQREVWRSEQSGFWNGGLLSTAGGLVFGGSADGRFRAFRASDGEVLWEVVSQTGIMAPPVSYEVDGDQFVLVAAGWGGGALAGPPVAEAIINRYHNEGRLLAFKLDGGAAMPRNRPRDTTVPSPPRATASADELARGKSLYHRECGLCHGFAAESALVVPDLRYLSAKRHREFDEIVLGGMLATRGMPSFANELSTDEAALIHQYVNAQAWKLHEASGGHQPMETTDP